jgi:non-heme chloroperoxidase
LHGAGSWNARRGAPFKSSAGTILKRKSKGQAVTNFITSDGTNRPQFSFDLTVPFYGFNRYGVDMNDGLRENFRRISLQGGIKRQYDCVHEFWEVDYTEDLRQIDRPTLVIHGDDDQTVPIAASAYRPAEIIADAALKIYPGGSHGLAEIEADRFNADVLAFIRA